MERGLNDPTIETAEIPFLGRGLLERVGSRLSVTVARLRRYSEFGLAAKPC